MRKAKNLLLHCSGVVIPLVAGVVHETDKQHIVRSLAGTSKQDVATVPDAGTLQDDIITAVFEAAVDEAAIHKMLSVETNRFVLKDEVTDDFQNDVPLMMRSFVPY